MRFRSNGVFSKGFKKLLAPQILNSVTAGRISSAVARQGVDLLSTYSGIGGTLSKYLVGNFDLGDCQNILSATEPSPATQTAGTNTTGLTRRMKLMKATAKYTLKNQTNIPIEVTLYDCTARRDTTSLTLNPLDAWNNGVTDQAVAFGSTVNLANVQQSNYPGARPFQSQTFCQTWKVKKTTNFVLHPGSEHIHRISIEPGGLLNNEYTRNFAALKGLTTTVLCVIKGGVVHDAATVTNVSYSTSVLDYVCEAQYRFTSLERSRTAYAQYNNLATIAAAAQATIIEDTDAATVVVNA